MNRRPLATVTLAAWEPSITVIGIRRTDGWTAIAKNKRTQQSGTATHQELKVAAERAVRLVTRDVQ